MMAGFYFCTRVSERKVLPCFSLDKVTLFCKYGLLQIRINYSHLSLFYNETIQSLMS